MTMAVPSALATRHSYRGYTACRMMPTASSTPTPIANRFFESMVSPGDSLSILGEDRDSTVPTLPHQNRLHQHGTQWRPPFPGVERLAQMLRRRHDAGAREADAAGDAAHVARRHVLVRHVELGVDGAGLPRVPASRLERDAHAAWTERPERAPQHLGFVDRVMQRIEEDD